MVSGHTSAIPALTSANQTFVRKKKAGAVVGPADGVCSSFG
ncbi:hypothetical protein STRTUCAR8_05921, partial [Streptomyces turgidiscabies Car8]